MLKRLFDILIATFALILLSPLFICLMLLIRIKLGEKVFFYQERPGRFGRSFIMIKFRTMIDAFDTEGNPLPDELRLSKFGKLLRSTSLDELPELINVFKGNMSLVGPRPLLMRYLTRYSSEQARRNEVKPGITGWAQVNGRNALEWEDKFKLDVWYVDHQSFCLDLKILLITAIKIFRRADIAHAGSANMPEFLGNQKRTGDFK